MEIDWDLEDWLLETGQLVDAKLLETGIESLSPLERLVHEVWVLDIETHNGGVSQYFCNYGLPQWKGLKEAWSKCDVPSLGHMIAGIERMIAGAEDPYQAAVNASPGVEEVYEAHQSEMKAELRRLWRERPQSLT